MQLLFRCTPDPELVYSANPRQLLADQHVNNALAAKARVQHHHTRRLLGWTAIDADSKLMVSYLVASRDAGSAYAFMHDVASRLNNRVQLTTDGYKPYLAAVSDAFNNDVDYAQLIKVYGQPADSTERRRYRPAECSGTIVGKTIGKPNYDDVSTSYVARSNLTVRMQNRSLYTPDQRIQQKT